MNNVVLIGRLTKDPSFKDGGEGGTSVARFNLAVDREGSRKDEADFPQIVCFGKVAETVSKYLIKGRQVAVLGRVHTGSYTDKEGNKVYTTDIVANRVEFLGSSGGGGAKAGDGKPAENAAPDVDGFEEVATDVPF